MQLIDVGPNLCHESFASDLADVLGRAAGAGVTRLIVTGTSVSDSRAAAELARRHPRRLRATAGVHPHEADAQPAADAETLAELARGPKVIGIGETGLDYHYENSPRRAQQESFRAHIRAARATGLPLIVHTRAADDDTIAILEEEAGRGAFRGVIHCFSAGPAVAECALRLGMSLSFSGIATFRNAEAVRDAARRAPADRILVETDAPFLAPVPMRGKRNEPAFVEHTARAVAALRGAGEEAFARQTTDNFFRLFDKAARPGAG